MFKLYFKKQLKHTIKFNKNLIYFILTMSNNKID